MQSACKLSKQDLPQEEDLLKALLSTYCYVTEDSGMLICRSELKYDY